MACCTPFRQSTNIVGKKWSFTKFSTKASNPSLLQFDKVNHHQLTLMSQIATKFELEKKYHCCSEPISKRLYSKSRHQVYQQSLYMDDMQNQCKTFSCTVFLYFHIFLISFYSHSCLPYKSEIQRMYYTKLIYGSFPFNLV